MIKYTGEKAYEKAVISATEDWLRYHLPAGSTGVKIHEVELLDLDENDVEVKVNYDITYSGIYDDEFENVTDTIKFETYLPISETYTENLQATKEDGWGEQIEEELAQSLDFAADIAYEVRNCVRGSYVVDGDKVEDLVTSLRSLVDGLEIAIENIESDAKSINESVEKRDVFCTDCDTVTTQTYKGSFKDGIRTLGRYICDRCGCENEDEPLTESKSIKEDLKFNLFQDPYKGLESRISELDNSIQKARNEIDRLEKEKSKYQDSLSAEQHRQEVIKDFLNGIDIEVYYYNYIHQSKSLIVQTDYSEVTLKELKDTFSGSDVETDHNSYKKFVGEFKGHKVEVSYNESDGIIIKIRDFDDFTKSVNESKSIKESTKKSYIFSKNESKYSLNSK